MNIYVGRLNPSATEESVREMFQAHGEVTSVKLIKDKFTGAFRGFGFVEMPNADEAQNAIAALHNQDIQGSRLVVNEARPQEERDSRAPRGPRPGGFGGSRGGFGSSNGGSSSNGGGYSRGGFGGSRDRNSNGGSRW